MSVSAVLAERRERQAVVRWDRASAAMLVTEPVSLPRMAGSRMPASSFASRCLTSTTGIATKVAVDGA